MLSRSAILRNAHATAKRLMAHDALLLPRARRWSSYRVAFAYSLRLAWGEAKELARQTRANDALAALEEAEADAVLAATPRNVIARVTALRRFAECQPFTIHGREARRSLLAEADDLALAARAIMIPAVQDRCHVAH